MSVWWLKWWLNCFVSLLLTCPWPFSGLSLNISYICSALFEMYEAEKNCAILLLDEFKIGFVLLALAWLTLACIVCEIVHRNFPISNKYLRGNYKIGNLSCWPRARVCWPPKMYSRHHNGPDRGRGHRGDNAWSQPGHNEPILHITHSMRHMARPRISNR